MFANITNIVPNNNNTVSYYRKNKKGTDGIETLSFICNCLMKKENTVNNIGVLDIVFPINLVNR